MAEMDATATAVALARRSQPRQVNLVEGATQTAILKYLQALGVVAWRMNSGVAWLPGRGGRKQPVRFGIVGLSDILGLLPNGRFLAIEVKRADEEPTPEQRAFLEAVRSSQGRAFVARSLNDVVRELAGDLAR